MPAGNDLDGDRDNSGKTPPPAPRSVRRSRWFVALGTGVAVALAAIPGGANTTTSTPDPAETETTTSEADTTTTAAPADTATTVAEGTDTTSTETTEATDTTESPDTTESTDTTTGGEAPASTDDAGAERVREAETAKAREVDAANAQLSELTGALATLQADVEAQSARLEIATRRLEAAQAVADATSAEVAELEAQVEELEFGLTDQAIRSFKGETVDGGVLALGSDPRDGMRRQAMLAKATQSDIDYANELAGVREDLEARRAETDEALALADASRQASEEQLAQLEDNRQAQFDLAGQAEARLDHLLSERAALADLGEQVGSDLDAAAADELVEQLANTPAPAPASTSGSGIPDPVPQSEIVVAAKGIEVHVSIVANVRQLLADAAADGIDLAGGGYRDPAQQIAVRRNNCGTSQYAIYEMPSSQCSPPTARPGRSQHEQGKAIDFTYNGALIRSRSGPGWAWLNANANKYGLYNLPSEPWHWSVNGR